MQTECSMRIPNPRISTEDIGQVAVSWFQISSSAKADMIGKNLILPDWEAT